MKVTCTRKLRFCAGHRVMGHESKCGHFHGHDYNLELTAQADLSKLDPHEFVEALNGQSGGVDNLGRVIDFSILKGKFDPWIQEKWDHGLILNEADPYLTLLRGLVASNGDPQKVFALPYNPTAENIGRYLLESLSPALLDGLPVRLIRAVVHETPNCFAMVEIEDIR